MKKNNKTGKIGQKTTDRPLPPDFSVLSSNNISPNPSAAPKSQENISVSISNILEHQNNSDTESSPQTLSEKITAILLTRLSFGAWISVSIHFLIFIILALFFLNESLGYRGGELNAGFSEESGDVPIAADIPELQPLETVSDADNALQLTETALELNIPDVSPSAISENLSESLAFPGLTSPSTIGTSDPLGNPNAGTPIFNRGKNSLAGRNPKNRTVGQSGDGGPTQESEDAVQRGLAWLAAHQLPDGSWAFDLSAADSNDKKGSCQGRCSNLTDNLHGSRMAATALALLPFYGAGYTHTERHKYTKTIQAGLYYIQRHIFSVKERGFAFGSGSEQQMYIQGITTLMLSEAYEMTEDKSLRELARGGIRFIEKAQGENGSWAYEPNMPGDTTITGWQVMALRSGIANGFRVAPTTIYRAGYFMDEVQFNEGSRYKYRPETPIHSRTDLSEQTTSAIGLLIRLYLGWKPDHPSVEMGVSELEKGLSQMSQDWLTAKKLKQGTKRWREFFDSNTGLYKRSLYCDYYTILVLHHYGGSAWQRSFPLLRDFLVETQVRANAMGGLISGHSSHESGSWLFENYEMNRGGRLLNTVFAILILETPYRYLPLYQKDYK